MRSTFYAFYNVYHMEQVIWLKIKFYANTVKVQGTSIQTFLLCNGSALGDVTDKDTQFVRLERAVSNFRLDREAKLLVTPSANQLGLKQQLRAKLYALVLLYPTHTEPLYNVHKYRHAYDFQ